MKRQVIMQGGKEAFVIVPIDEWRRIETTLEDRADSAAVRDYLKNPSETYPDSVMAEVLDGTHPLKVFRRYRGMTQAQLAKAVGSSAVYVSQIERGGRRAGRKLRAKLGAALRVDPSLLDREA